MTPGPHPVVAYFHGGGWVLGSAVSDDAFCRDVCVRADALVVSVDYRHAPEAKFAALPKRARRGALVAANAESLGGRSGALAVAGTSARRNIAAVVSRLARDAGGPAISAQLLLVPARHGSAVVRRQRRGLRADCGAAPLVLGPRHRSGAARRPTRVPAERGGPLRPPAGRDRDRGVRSAARRGRRVRGRPRPAGVPVRHIRARGHTHASFAAGDVVPSGAPVRADMADALRAYLTAAVSA